ncbi:MAG TPA: alkaline phosphatase D family protein [Marinobacterium sp.]|nr:alkaline phosphatase D family protein [Marinobacterium sp.]
MTETATTHELPPVLAGPILRRTSAEQICMQILTSQPLEYSFQLSDRGRELLSINDGEITRQRFQLGEYCWLDILILRSTQALPLDSTLHYDLKIGLQGGLTSIAEWGAELIYPDESLPSLRIPSRLNRLAHGSCRKPHHRGGDGLVRLDQQCAANLEQRPDLLIMSGDQLYADDVAGPMLRASHQVAEKLGLADELLHGTSLSSAAELELDSRCYYRRSELLPNSETNEEVRKSFFEAKRKPIFTSDSARNHLITLREVIAAYALLWSPNCWKFVDLNQLPSLSTELELVYQRERESIEEFAAGMSRVARVMANTPCYMIFDDHDVTDDWNLSAAWEVAAYGHPFSARIIGNAMLGYLLFQALGNEPKRLGEAFFEPLSALFTDYNDQRHHDLIQQMQNYPYWGYEIPVEPGIVVLDTRTQRWRSERNPQSPSGLMDWEQLVDLQQTLLNRKQVILVSAAPIFGVKLIEAIQRLFTWLGRPLMVDAENWMAHPGSANVILNIFRHSRTPEQFVVLSGDVHYSFVYDIKLRFRNAGPRIYQITSSGIRNAFPSTLLSILDRLNRWLYASWSPLNWLTKRRLMRIRPRVPSEFPPGRRLVNTPGIGWIEFDSQGVPVLIQQLGAQGEDHRFHPSKEDEHWS